MSHSAGASPVEVGHDRWRVLVDALSMGIYKNSLGNFFKFRHSRESGIPVSLNCSLRGCRRFRLTARYFLCSCKESTQRKHAPTVPVATRLPCDARSLRRLRNSHPQSVDCGCSDNARRRPLRALRFSAGPTGAPKRSRTQVCVVGVSQKENEASLLLRLGPRWARREAQAGRGQSVADV